MTKKTELNQQKKRRVPSTAYSTEHPSPNAFQPGQSPNPGGKPSGYRALARALRISGAGRAPNAECDVLGLPHGSSKIQVAAERIVHTMRRGTPSEQLQACELFARLTGEFAPTRLALGFDPDMGEEGEEGSIGGPRLIVNFVSSQHDLEKERVEGKLIDRPPLSRDIDPAAAAAAREAESTGPRGEQPLAPQEPPTPKAKPWPALAAPRPTAEPQSAQAIRAATFKKLGYPI